MVLARRDKPARNRRDRMLFRLIPTADKKLIEYDSGHYMPPARFHREILTWLGKHL